MQHRYCNTGLGIVTNTPSLRRIGGTVDLAIPGGHTRPYLSSLCLPQYYYLLLTLAMVLFIQWNGYEPATRWAAPYRYGCAGRAGARLYYQTSPPSYPQCRAGYRHKITLIDKTCLPQVLSTYDGACLNWSCT
ncbi:hypothetical protein PLICRDRAFT_530734 [Plicaturopsis crispa FD-325 SS-3]|nr:hypothetical protein PLICRDRAFT_530734 [Plicaturopsis crispa FD-325 SS-3]